MKPRSLPVLGGFFLCTFIGRAIVLAAEAQEPMSANRPPSPPGRQCLTSALADELKSNLDSLDARAAALADREGLVRAATAQAEKRIAELEALNAALAQKLDHSDAARASEVKRLAAIYEQMKPTLASAIFSRMDPQFAAGLLMSLNGETASAILSGLDSERAYSITVLMANRAMNAGEEL